MANGEWTVLNWKKSGTYNIALRTHTYEVNKHTKKERFETDN